MIPPALLAAHLARLVGAADFPEPGGVWRPGTRPVTRVGFALDPAPGIGDWIRQREVDALFLHRPWKLDAAALPGDVSVHWSHLPFDERLAVGHNPHLAAALGMAGVRPFGERDGRPLGMIGDVAAIPADDALARVRGVFGGVEDADAGTRPTIRRVVVVGAMTDALVRAAHDAGADLFLTGQRRAPAARAVAETGIAVAAVGHRRGERWGLRLLARLVAEAAPGVETVVCDEAEGTFGAGSGADGGGR